MYYAATTLTAVVLGIVLVNVLNPGRGSPLNGDGVSDCAVDQVQPCEGPKSISLCLLIRASAALGSLWCYFKACFTLVQCYTDTARRQCHLPDQ
jgi:hypothetical protein